MKFVRYWTKKCFHTSFIHGHRHSCHCLFIYFYLIPQMNVVICAVPCSFYLCGCETSIIKMKRNLNARISNNHSHRNWMDSVCVYVCTRMYKKKTEVSSIVNKWDTLFEAWPYKYIPFQLFGNCVQESVLLYR